MRSATGNAKCDSGRCSEITSNDSALRRTVSHSKGSGAVIEARKRQTNTKETGRKRKGWNRTSVTPVVGIKPEQSEEVGDGEERPRATRRSQKLRTGGTGSRDHGDWPAPQFSGHNRPNIARASLVPLSQSTCSTGGKWGVDGFTLPWPHSRPELECAMIQTSCLVSHAGS